MTDTTKLRELLAKATPGPWHVVTMHGWGGICIGRKPQDEANKTAGDAPIAKVVDRAPHWENCFPVEANAQLIAAARNELPALLDELDALRAERDRLRSYFDEANDALARIGDFAHGRSTGPAVPDALWEIRCLAYETVRIDFDLSAALAAQVPQQGEAQEPAASAVPYCYARETRDSEGFLVDVEYHHNNLFSGGRRDGFPLYRHPPGQPAASAEPTWALIRDHLGSEIADMLCVTHWKDGIDIQEPVAGLKKLIAACAPVAAQAPAVPEGYRLMRLELLERAADVIGRFVGDEGWCQYDMDLADEFSAALAAAPTPPASGPTMDDAIAAGDGTLHGAIDYWQQRALKAEASQAPAAAGDALEDYKTNGAAAVRFAPSSAHWSSELRRLFGPDAREGIDRLEARLREAELDAARYRFIRGQFSPATVMLYGVDTGLAGTSLDEEIDDAIEDAAMKRTSGGDHE